MITVSYLVIAPSLPVPVAGTDARTASWVPVETVPSGLAFDHDEILADGLEVARSKLENTTLATAFCPDTFTIGELRRVYEVVWGTFSRLPQLQPEGHEHRGFVLPTGKTRSLDTGRPAVLYRQPARPPPCIRRSCAKGSTVAANNSGTLIFRSVSVVRETGAAGDETECVVADVRADVVVLTALDLEYAAVRAHLTGCAPTPTPTEPVTR